MLQPIVGRTWAPVGRTPVLVQRERRDRYSVIAAMTYRPQARRRPFGMYFLAYNENVNTWAATEFIRRSCRTLGKKLLVVWDNLRVHHAAQKALSRMRGSLSFAYLPPYAPQANPVEFLWAHSKGKDLANYVPDTKAELGEHLVHTLCRTRRRCDVLKGCFHAAGLRL
jgi:hypothetical protein